MDAAPGQPAFHRPNVVNAALESAFEVAYVRVLEVGGGSFERPRLGEAKVREVVPRTLRGPLGVGGVAVAAVAAETIAACALYCCSP